MDIYEDLLKDIGSLKEAQEVEDSGLDDFFIPEKMKIASLGDLSEFFRASTDTLVHKAKKDLWKITEDKNGSVFIERLFDPNDKKPLKV